MRISTSLVALVLAALPARALAGADTTWQTDDSETAARKDDYAKAMSDGDDAAMLAASESVSQSRMKKLVLQAARAYERAAQARPDLAEPHWRAANVLYGFFVDCDLGGVASAVCLGTGRVDVELYRRIIGHWEAVETVDPLDPRITSILFDRAILHTWLATDDDLRAAIKDYEAVLDRSQHTAVNSPYIVLGNLAESYMMVGDLDKAIERYQEALRGTQETSLYYGLAVAYDRAGEGARARDVIRALGEDEFHRWEERVAAGDTFYVPEGEVFYYYALCNEVFGDPDTAIADWQRYIDSGAHPIFDDRARDNLNSLVSKQKQTSAGKTETATPKAKSNAKKKARHHKR